jgi:hypothetical protein
MDKVHKHSGSECYTTSPEPYRFYKENSVYSFTSYFQLKPLFLLLMWLKWTAEVNININTILLAFIEFEKPKTRLKNYVISCNIKKIIRIVMDPEL